jgi:arylsulfatase A-like enzyme
MEDMGCEIPPYGDTTQKTPSLSRLAEEGMVFGRVNVSAASCALSRASLFSGLYPHQNGIWGFVDSHGWHYRKGITTFVEQLNKAGYRTGLTYKTGVSAADKIPFAFRRTYYSSPYVKTKGRNHQKISNCIDCFREFLETLPKGQPFYFQGQINDTHNPWVRENEPEFIRGMKTKRGLNPIDPEQVKVSNFPSFGKDMKLTGERKTHLAGYYGAIQRVDYYVGEMLALLESFGHADNTLVIFSSDHEPCDINRRGKVTSYELGVRVPFIVRWPGVVKPGTRSNALVSNVDLFPTFCDVAGAALTESLADRLAGHSLVPVFNGSSPGGVRRFLFTAFNAHGNTSHAMLYPGRTINDGSFKLIHHLIADGKTPRGKTRHGGNPYWPYYLKESLALSGPDSEAAAIVARTRTPPPFELYDLENDPGETTNLADNPTYNEEMTRLKGELDSWREGTDDPLRDAAVLKEFVEEWWGHVEVYNKLKKDAVAGLIKDKRWKLDKERWIESSDPSKWAKDPATEPPNVVLILADDLGFGDISVYNGKSMVRTPHLDTLASEGARFTDAHTSGNICVPSRYALMTGEHTFFREEEQTPVYRFSDGQHWDPVPTLPRMFRQSGYDTAMVGKWHLDFFLTTRKGVEVLGRTVGSKRNEIDWLAPLGDGPLSWGFDTWFGMLKSANMQPFAFYDGRRVVGEFSDEPFRWKRAARPGLAVEGWTNEAILPTLTEKSLDFLRSRKGNPKPFFLYFALTAPHTPHAPAGQFIENEFERKNLYLPFVRQVDWTVGQVLGMLEEAGLSENTLVVFTSDNGPELMSCGRIRTENEEGELVRHTPSGPWRGGKFTDWEGGHRVPFLLRWPGRVKPGTVSDTPFMLSDSLATFAGLLNVELPSNVAIDSVNVLDAWTGRATKDDYKDRILVHVSRRGGAIRQGKWKLLLEDDKRVRMFGGELVELYDLEKDPKESTNLAAAYPEVVDRLRKLREAEKQRLRRVAVPR